MSNLNDLVLARNVPDDTYPPCSKRKVRVGRAHHVEQNAARKVARRANAAAGSSILDFSDDILNNIFCFFVSSNGVVDGTSLEACMEVSHKWKCLLTSTSIWRIPARLLSPSKSAIHSIQNSLQIKDTCWTYRASDGRYKYDSLLGFTKLGRIPTTPIDDSNFVVFHALERATNSSCILKISTDYVRAPIILKEAFITHFLRGNARKFCSPKNASSSSDPSTCFGNQLAQGVCLLFDQCVFWYGNEDSNQKGFPCHVLTDNGHQPTMLSSTSLPSLFRLFSSCFAWKNNISEKERTKCAMKYLLDLEGHPLASVPGADQMPPIFHMDRWAKLVDWVIEIIECFDLEDRLAYRALFYFDWLASSPNGRRVRRDKYQLYAGTALLIANKCESAVSPRISIDDIAFSADNTFGSMDIKRAEDAILSSLGWRLALPTILDFVELYISYLSPYNHPRAVWLIRYISELSLQTTIHSLYLPSKIASCIVVLALFCLGQENSRVDIWPSELEELTESTLDSLEECLVTLTALLDDVRRTMPDLTIIGRRYKRDARGNVASFHIPKIASLETLRGQRAQYQQRF